MDIVKRFLWGICRLNLIQCAMYPSDFTVEGPHNSYILALALFWSSRREAWPRMVPQTSSVSKVFGSRALERFRSDLTLLEATERNDDVNNAFSHLLKQSSAALLNSYARKDFPYSAWEVKTLLIQGLVSEEAAALQAQRFSLANGACT
ncbi:hypothetical protein HHK36_032147 [Tetracentron sinense]|uniref:Uncharacterized protein n=1 Tax=Tetracentron sinense TaxID=13715 RepID=A0A834YAS6_TETSI|nr:hypothetical protein HHK36_032147 [Tetracentron sinense]